jgi:hypothetical protein
MLDGLGHGQILLADPGYNSDVRTLITRRPIDDEFVEQFVEALLKGLTP